MRSIASRLFWTQLVASVGLAVLVGLLLYLRVRSGFAGQFDQALGGKATSLAALMRIGPKGFNADFEQSSLPEFSRNDRANYLQVVNSDGDVMFHSLSLGNTKLPFDVGTDPVRYRDLNLRDGSRGRCIVLKFTPTYDIDDFEPKAAPTELPRPMYLTLAQSRSELDDRLQSLLTAMVAAAVTMAIGIVLVTVLTTRAGLSHLRRFAAQVEQIDSRELHGRIDVQAIPAELQPISSRLNELLSRLEAAFNRERRFTADAAHELRTPIAELRTLAEVALRDEAATIDSHMFFGDAFAVARQMESLVEALLALARGQSMQQRLRPVDISAVALAAWDRSRPAAEARQLAVTVDAQPGLTVLADPVVLNSIFTNLFNNAADHSPRNGSLAWSLAARDRQVVLTIENTNQTLSCEDLAHVAEPFWRKSAARSGGHHSGLGLALVKAWSDMLHATHRFELSEDGKQFRAIFTIELVAAAAPEPVHS